MAYDNTNTVKIWKVEKKNPKEPDYKIDINWNGEEFQLPLWKRGEAANPNGPIFTGKIERPQKTKKYPDDRITTGRLPPKQSILPDDDQDVPF